MIGPDTSSALNFLHSWIPGGPWTLTAIEPDTKRIETRTFVDTGTTRSWVDRWQGLRNIYFSVNQPKFHLRKKAEKTDIGLGIGLHVDLDAPAGADLSKVKPELISRLQNYDLPPTVIIDSGGGAQGFWRFREPAAINGSDSVTHFEALNRGIENAVGGDHCHNIDRIMRLPGTINIPDEKKRAKGRKLSLARVVHADWDRKYDLDDFEPANDSVAAKPNGHAESAFAAGGEVTEGKSASGTAVVDLTRNTRKPRDGSRSGAAFRLGAKLKRSGSTFEQMCDTLRTDPETGEWYREQGNSKRQLQRIWDKVQDGGRDLPIIKITGGELPAIVDQVNELVVEHDHELFQRGGMVVRPAREEIDIADGGKTLAWRLVQVRRQHLVDRLTRIIDFQKYDKRSKEWLSINCPDEVAGAYLERVGYWKLPIITGIVDAPTLRPDGSIIETPGYDAVTGLLYKPSCEYTPVLPNPTKEQAGYARDFLCELIDGFPFVGDDGEIAKGDNEEIAKGKASASRSVALSLILTSCSRHAIVRAPMHGFDAPVAGSGKSLLVDIASMISSGHEAAVMNAGKSEEEFEKRLGAALLAGDPLISFDNCERPLGGELLCQCLTQRRVKVRILGKSEQPMMPCGATFSATGNNLILTGDVTRRAIVSRLDPKVERPEEREFTDNPIEMIKRDRTTYVRAALTILRAYITAGKPKQDRKPLGSYEEWSRLVRDALIWLGEPDPVATMEKVRNEDPKLQTLGEVLNQWFAVAKAESFEEVTVKRLVEVANSTSNTSPDPQTPRYEIKHPDLRDALAAVAGDQRGNINTVMLGRWLSTNNGRVVNGLRFEHGAQKAMGGLVRWHVQGPQ